MRGASSLGIHRHPAGGRLLDLYQSGQVASQERQQRNGPACGCWAHLRRKFYDLHISGVSKAATTTLGTMAELWRIEDQAPWSDEALLARVRSLLLPLIEQNGPIEAWIVDGEVDKRIIQ
jgi:transposase